MTYDFSAHSKEYEEILGKSHKYFLQTKCNHLLRTLKKRGCNPQTVLDLGCGTGEVEEMLWRHFDQMTGIDPSEGMIHEARRKKIPHCEFKRADALELPFPDGVFDCVFAFCLFHHLPVDKLEQAMAEAARVCKKSAMLLTFEHNPNNPITRRMVSECAMDEGVTLITSRQMGELYKKTGIQILETRFIIFFPRLLAFLRPIENMLYGVPYGGQYYVVGLVKK